MVPTRVVISTVRRITPSSLVAVAWQPMHIPVKLALYGKDGVPLALDDQGSTSQVVQLKQQSQTWVYDQIDHEPVSSLFQGFSAPVVVQRQLSLDQLAFLMKYDADPFNRWDAALALLLLAIVSSWFIQPVIETPR